MRIKSMEINGFKSYGTKTEIEGFDALFNAITGLNGSGKSNILDAICFVLGISNLSQVRASSLQELVYKNGQAGVTKASVSITFDNSDPGHSPLGYETVKEIIVTRLVIIGGRNKYLINGVTANNNRVQDFFQSVHLNVNNPHFLIMQGRITKVLNMKPQEILSMIEEAAGTRMYETKKESSLKLMAKKETRLAEIDNILIEDITPTLNKLRTERKDYTDYTKITRELDHLNKLYIAWQFLQAQEMSTKSGDDAKKLQDELEASQQHIGEVNVKITAVDEQIALIEKKKDEEAGGKLHTMEASLKEKQMAETKISSRLQILKDALKEENKKKKELTKNFNEDESSVAHKEKELDRLQSMVLYLQETCEKDAQTVTAAQKQFQAVSAGLSSNTEGEAATLADQLMSAKSDIANAETEEKQAEMKLSYAKKDVLKKQEACKKTSDSYKKDQAAYQLVEKEANKLQQEIQKLEYEEGKEEQLLSEKKKLIREIDSLREKLNMMHSRFPQLSFEYVDPIRNFDRKKVHGLVCKLIKIKDPTTAVALELTAGGKLYNVVVDNEVTGKQLLDRGQLRRRCTIIPLNKIIGRPIENDVVHRAERLVGKPNVSTALSLVGYEKDVESAMQYVFGGTFVCPSMEPAKAVTFADGIKKRSVTIDGEVFDPAGTLSGGSMGQRNKMLLELSQINDVEREIHHRQQKLDKIVKELSQINEIAERYRILHQKFEIKEREAELLKSRLEQSTHHQQLEEVQALQLSIEEQQTIVTKSKEMKKKAETRVKDLQLKITDSKSVREQELKNAEKAVSNSKKQAESSSKKFKEIQQQVDSLRLEAEEIRKGLSSYEEQIVAVKETIKNSEEKIADVDSELRETRNAVTEATSEVKTQKSILKAHSAEIVKLNREKEAMAKDVENTNLHMQQLEHDVAKSHADSKDAEKRVEKYLANYQWIEEEKKFFGVPNTEYDFTKHNPQNAANRINKLQEMKGKLSKNINMRAQNMLTTAEEQYDDLVKKKQIVLADKVKIEAVIRELDDKKRSAVISACEKVGHDFGSIFTTLLPGTKAKLVASEGRSVLDGVEFKVAFGDVWKESLTELSGGQRSLVALSLILAMLLFKPAPIYILDEIDAALDLSHTQNIGKMLKTHFKHSQFIIVSLKDGMFNNANVLFQTKFVDGMSTVSRTTTSNLQK